MFDTIFAAELEHAEDSRHVPAEDQLNTMSGICLRRAGGFRSNWVTAFPADWTVAGYAKVLAGRPGS
jgi:hypothetical protein